MASEQPGASKLDRQWHQNALRQFMSKPKPNGAIDPVRQAFQQKAGSTPYTEEELRRRERGIREMNEGRFVDIREKLDLK